MKQIAIAFYGIFMLSMAAVAQPVLTNSSTPAPGDVLEVFMVEDTDFTQGPSGVGITWDFSSIEAPQVQSAVFKEVINTTFSVFFPTSTIAIEYDDGLPVGSFQFKYEYYTATADSWIRDGLVNNADLALQYDDPELLMTYPFEYQDEFTDDFSTTFMQASNTINRTGTITVEADGYGSLILPDYTAEDILRVRILREYTDEVVGTGLSFVTTVETYAWFTPGLAYPLLNITTETVNDSPTTAVTTVQYMLPFESVGIDNGLLATSDFTAYPNPSNDLVNFSYELTNRSEVQLSVYNMLGQRVAMATDEVQAAGTHTTSIEVDRLASGIYLAELVINGKKVSRKIQVL